MIKKDSFVSPEKFHVLIPYSDLEKMVNMAQEMEEMKRQFKRIEEQYAAVRGMFSECLDKIAEIRDYVKDS